MHSVLSTVEAGEGVAIVSASARNLRADNVSFYRLQPDDVRIDFVAAWQQEGTFDRPQIVPRTARRRTARDSTEDAFPITRIAIGNSYRTIGIYDESLSAIRESLMGVVAAVRRLKMGTKQKTVIVTGASQGIGAGVVQAFLDRGLQRRSQLT